MASFLIKYTELLAFSLTLVFLAVVVRIQVGPPQLDPRKRVKLGAFEYLTLEQWKMRGMRSIALLFNFS